MLRISRASDADLDSQISEVLRNLLNEAFEGDFSEEDWQHTFGGMRFLGFLNDQLIAHGAVVRRKIKVDESDLIIGYVEGIAVAPTYWHKGYGSLLMADITSYCLSEFSLSMLSTSEKGFYRKHGWCDFEGMSYVFKDGVEIRSEDEDEGLMYLSGLHQFTDYPRKVVCEARDGDAW